MQTAKIAITLDRAVLAQLDRRVTQQVFPQPQQCHPGSDCGEARTLGTQSSRAECAKLNPVVEQALAEEGSTQELAQWPEY